MTNYLKKAWLMRFVVNPVWEVVKFVVKPVWLVLKFVWAAVKSTPAAVKDGLAATRGDMSGWDLIHFIVSAVLLARALLSLLRHWSGLPAVVAVDLYLLVLLLLAACRCYSLLPDRFTALFMALFTFAALVFGFATVFLENGCFEKRELGMNSRTKRVTVSSTNLPDAREATYVSLAVITTAAPDYAPTTREGRSAVAFETVSGLLFLLVAFPILAARLAVFEGLPKAPDGKFRVQLADGKWQFTVVTTVATEGTGVPGEKADFVIKNGRVVSATKQA